MEGRTDPRTIEALLEAAPNRALIADEGETPLSLLIPSFMLSEVKRGFEIGFLVFLPFLIIDLVVASILMSMGMMMVPPAIVSLPFKLVLFVLADGWFLVVGSLMNSFQ